MQNLENLYSITIDKLSTRNFMHCELHGDNAEATLIGTCSLCKKDEEIKKQALEDKQSFIKKQEKANIQQDIIYKDASFDNYYPTCQKSRLFKLELSNYNYDCNILLCGNSGTGKSHIAHALVNKALLNDKTAYYALFYRLARLQIKHENEFEYMLKCDFVVIDEFGVQESDYKNSLIYDILDSRARRGKWTMLVTNLCGEEFASKLPTALQSRLKLNILQITDIDWDDYRIKKGVKNEN
jgi:DNA replication protein DnaC